MLNKTIIVNYYICFNTGNTRVIINIAVYCDKLNFIKMLQYSYSMLNF